MRFLKFTPASVLLAVLLTVLFGWKPFSPPDDVVCLEIPLESTAPGIATLQTWNGSQHWNALGLQSRVAANDPKQVVRFTIPGGLCYGIVLDPLDRPGRLQIGAARVLDADGKVIWQAAADAWKESRPVGLHPISESRMELSTGVFSRQPALQLDPGKAWNFPSGREIDPLGLVAIALALSAVFVLIAVRYESQCSRAWQNWKTRWGSIAEWAKRSPFRALAVVAVLSVICSCFPAIFCGKSFVSPKTGALCLYEGYPTVPGIESLDNENARNSDTLVMQLGHRPYSKFAYESIYERGEFPLWNHYNNCGTPFIGQGLSMLGDPLHWLPIASNGASWAWDVKFLIARFLFAWGIALCVWMATARIGVAALLGFCASFFGFFAFRMCHPAYFSMCYAPWILLAWQRIAAGHRWALILVLACTMEFHSGTAKESAIFIAGMNGTGALLVLFGPIANRWRHLLLGCSACLAFVLINAPFWLVFLDTLKESFTTYASPPVIQIQPAALLGLFDDAFFHRLTARELHSFPAANFVVLAGFLLALTQIRSLWKMPIGRTLIVASIPSIALAFGIVPASVIRTIPFLANVSHVGNTFGCVLIVQFTLLAGLGFSAWTSPEKEHWKREWGIVVAILAVLAAVYFVAASPIGADAQPTTTMPPMSPFAAAYMALVLAGVAFFPALVRTGTFTARLAMCAVLAVLLFRHAQWGGTKFDFYVLNPQERTSFSATSPAVESLRPLLGEPGRVAGLREVLMPGYNAALRLESICSSDPLSSRYLRELIDETPIKVVWNWRTTFQAETLVKTQPASDFFNLRFFLAPRGSPLPASFRRLSASDLEVWESPSAWPRAFFADQVASYKTATELAQMIAGSNGAPFAATQDASKASAAPDATRRVTPAKRISVSTNATVCEFEAPSAGMAVLSESWFEGDMLVSLNGQRAKPVRVNHAFRGVEIPAAGHYTVEFRYRPRRLTIALWMSAIGGILATGLLWMTRRAGNATSRID